MGMDLDRSRFLDDAFGQARFRKNWADTLPRMQHWLAKDERRAA